MSNFNLSENEYHQQSLANAVAAATGGQQQYHHQQQQQQQQQQPPHSPAPMFPGPSTIPTNFSSGQINSAEALQQFQTDFWKAHMASIEENVPDFKTHLLPLARIKKVMKSDPDVKVQMISAEAPILFSKACEIFITEITQRAWMNAEENKRRTLQRQDVSFAAQRSEMFDFLIDVVPREEFANKKTHAVAGTAAMASGAAKDEQGLQQHPGKDEQTQQSASIPQQQQQQHQQQQQPSLQQQHHPVQPPQQQVQQPQQQPQSASLYDPAFQQYYAHQFAEAAAGYPQSTAGPTPEQRQAYYQQIEREQLQWLQRQTNMGAGQSIPGQFGTQRIPGTGGSDDVNMSPTGQQHDIGGNIKSEDQ
ncbi:hypothetical protein LPJ73_006483, partial [Coemansia sp. RSA 2703]